jgi:hypothetical protein
MLTGDPRWTHRRRLVYGTVAFASMMVLIGALDWSDRQVSSQLVIGGVSLISLVLSGFVFAATLDDKWQRADHEPNDFDSAYGSSDADGMAGKPSDRLAD